MRAATRYKRAWSAVNGVGLVYTTAD